MIEKRAKDLLEIAMAITIAVLIYYVFHFGNFISKEEVAGAIAIMLVLPHVLLVVIALLFNVLGRTMNSPGFALTSGILYLVSIVFMPIYFIFVIAQSVLCFVAYGRMKKANSV